MIFQFRCVDCLKVVEVEAPIGISPTNPGICPRCGGDMIRRFDSPKIHYRCSGFYATDKVLSEPTEDQILESEL